MEKNYNKILDEIVENKGIEFIKEYLNKYNKIQRRKQINTNKYDEVAKEVYNLMHNHGYSNTKAIEKIANIRDLSYNTVRNHYANFNKEAKEFDYYSFGSLVDTVCFDSLYGNYQNDISQLAEANNITYEVADTYYTMYKNFKKKEKPKLDYKKFTMPNYMKSRVPNNPNNDELPV